MNICGCLIHIAPNRAGSAHLAITETPGVEIHAVTEDGRFVVVVEDTSSRLASETIMDLHQIPGVISLSLTYHHFEDVAAAHPRSDAPSQAPSRRPMP
ncbi:MAG: chaperone NapD [Paracoccaceae bacterium]